MNAGVHSGSLGVPAYAVGLFATSPRPMTGCGLSASIPHAKHPHPRRTRTRRPKRIPKHIRDQWLPGNWNRYTDAQWGVLMGISAVRARQERIAAGYHKYATHLAIAMDQGRTADLYCRLFNHRAQMELAAA